MLKLSLQPAPDTKLEEACATAVRVSNLIGIPVSFGLTGIYYEAKPGMTLEGMLAEFDVKPAVSATGGNQTEEIPATPPTAPADTQPKATKKGTGKSKETKPAAEPPAEGKE